MTLKWLGTVHRIVVESKGPASGVTESFDLALTMVFIAMICLNPQASGILVSLGFSFFTLKFKKGYYISESKAADGGGISELGMVPYKSTYYM